METPTLTLTLQVAALLEADVPEPTLPPSMTVRRLLQLQPCSQVRFDARQKELRGFRPCLIGRARVTQAAL